MSLLPAGFESLEPFAAEWAVEGTNARALLRGSSSEADRTAFFDAMKAQIDPALTYLDTKPLGGFDAAEQRLMNMTLSFAHVALACEIQRDDEAKHTPHRDKMVITRSPAGA